MSYTLSKLISLADRLDKLGFKKEADVVDNMLSKFAAFTFTDDESGEEIEIPTKNAMCDVCDGEGKMENPAFSGGITGSEWENDWDDESRDLYMRGGYDVKCSECDGKKIIKVPDLSAVSPEVKAKYEKYLKDEQAFRAEQESERRWGA